MKKKKRRPRKRYDKKCQFPKCDKTANFGTKRREPIYCGTHKREGVDWNVRKPPCEVCIENPEILLKQAIFGQKPGEKLRCGTHKIEGDIDNLNKKCVGCVKDKIVPAKRPCFGPPGGFVRRCAMHKIEGDVSIYANLCIDCPEDNKVIAGYGNPNDRKRVRCGTHKLSTDVDLTNKRCECGKHKPYFGSEGGEAIHCSECKLDTDVPLKCKHCIVCNKPYPTYGFEKRKSLYCSEHRIEGTWDVVNKMCEVCEENGVPVPTQACFGPPGGSRTRCEQHKLDTDVNVVSPQCEFPGCTTQPSFGLEKNKPLRCCTHAKEKPEYRDVVHPMCKSCNLYIIIEPPHLCSYCRPDTPKRLHTKEMKVVNFLKESIPKEMIYNKVVGRETECGRYRPDILYDCGSHLIIVEVDEYQHESYAENCENIIPVSVKLTSKFLFL